MIPIDWDDRINVRALNSTFKGTKKEYWDEGDNRHDWDAVINCCNNNNYFWLRNKYFTRMKKKNYNLIVATTKNILNTTYTAH